MSVISVAFLRACDCCGESEQIGPDEIFCYPCKRKHFGYSPDLAINWNCCADLKVPAKGQYISLEVVQVSKDENDYCEPVEKLQDAQFLSLYGRREGGDVECLHDFPEGCLDVVAIVAECQGAADLLDCSLTDCTAF